MTASGARRFQQPPATADLPLQALLVLGGVPLVLRLAWRAVHGEFGADHLAGVSILGSIALHEYLAGSFVVLMLAGGAALERLAVARATAVLLALARRVPTMAHRSRDDRLEDVPVW